MKVLVVVDMQNDFITGSLGTPEAQTIVPNVKKKIEESVENGDIIFYTYDTHEENYLETKEGKKLPVKHCIYESEGWKVPEELRVRDYKNCYRVSKATFGCYNLPSMLEECIRHATDEPTEIELVGLCTDICVISNALLLKAYFYEKYDISVDATCCAGVTSDTHEAALQAMEMCQINVKR